MESLPAILESINIPGRGPASEEAVRECETAHGVVLPKWLTSLLLILDGGMIKGTEYEICPVEQIQWVEEDLDDDPEHQMRLLWVGFGPHDSRLVLDYTKPGEPSIRILYMDVGGELDSIDSSFLRAVGIEEE